MKTLKKILSVVLVVAMLASMLIVGAAAAETEKTNYEEAVAVVTGVGIIEGDENGMNFTGIVTREQAAKIISYLLLGKNTAESLKTTTAPFADVAATRWSAGYIA
ncbi:MAG: S-layer homology domain-containing protein, partial [Oscillospiraceae bacterium]|nr:S-layer homology domain-containing protein [Oscillospiraceae bacterium]